MKTDMQMGMLREKTAAVHECRRILQRILQGANSIFCIDDEVYERIHDIWDVNSEGNCSTYLKYLMFYRHNNTENLRRRFCFDILTHHWVWIGKQGRSKAGLMAGFRLPYLGGWGTRPEHLIGRRKRRRKVVA